MLDRSNTIFSTRVLILLILLFSLLTIVFFEIGYDLFTIINGWLRVAEVSGVVGAMYFSYKSATIAQKNIEEIKKEERPRVVVFVKNPKGNIHQVNLIIKNEGKKSARDITLKIKGDDFVTFLEKKLSENEIIKNGIIFLACGEKIIEPVGYMIGEQYLILKNVKTLIKIEYFDDNGVKYEDNFYLDFKSLTNIQIGKKNNEKIAVALQEISKDICKIKNDFERYSNKGIAPIRPETYYKDVKNEITGILGK